jgi:polyisoprenoid-binding protein YceI
MRLATLATVSVTLFILTSSATAQSVWNIDPAHSAAQFQVKHLMISTVRGEFGRLSGTVSYDGKNFTSVKAEATIDVASINTREKKRDDHLRSADFFDAANYPTIVFKSKRVEAVLGNNFNLVGDLTIRGVTKEIILAVEATPVIKGMGGESRIGAHATCKLNRQDYGVKWNRALDSGGVVVSDEVQVTLDMELVQDTKTVP